MPGLQYTRSESLFQLSHIRNQFHYGVDPLAARQEVINRLQFTQLPAGVTPQISPESPTGEILRYTLHNPKDAAGKPIYSLNDLKSLEDYTLERLVSPTAADHRRGEFRRHRETLRDPSRSGAASSLRDHASTAQGRRQRRQRQHRRAIRRARRDRASGPGLGADRPRAGSDGQGFCAVKTRARRETCCAARKSNECGRFGKSW